MNKLIISLLFIAFSLFFGQACEPAFQVPSESLMSLTTAYLNDAEKAECATVIKRREGGFRNLQDLVNYLNEQPRPVKLHCVIANLPRPLKIQIGVSSSSAQPSAGEANPRILLQVGSLILAVVPDGTAKNTLEVGAIKSASQATRAEFLFPINDSEIRENVGLDHIRFGGGTSCGLCHRNETVETAESVAGAFRSDLIRFSTSERRSLSSLKQMADDCVASADESDRCRLLRSLMEGGMPSELQF